MQPESNENLLTTLLTYPKADSVPEDLLSKLFLSDSTFSFDSSIFTKIPQDFFSSKLSLFFSILPKISAYIASKSIHSETFFFSLWKFYLPFGLHLYNRFQTLKKPFIQGIVGVQGAGKTTFTEIIVLILEHLKINVQAVSIDDFYKTYQERQSLKEKDPRFKWRGPPGTHDLSQAIALCKAVKDEKGPFSFPVFDKSLHQGEGDRIDDRLVEKVDIVLFEGWFVGMRPMEKGFFLNNSDFGDLKDREFAEDVSLLLRDYCELWDLFNDLIILWPENVDFSKNWRVEAEEKMKGKGKEGKSKCEIEDFVEYFWKAVNPKLYLEDLKKRKGASFMFSFNFKHELTKIEAFGEKEK